MTFRFLSKFAFFLGLVAATLSGWPIAAQTTGQEQPGERPGAGRVLLPNQWSLDPVGRSRQLGLFPMNMRLSPDGQYLAVVHCGSGDHEIMVFATSDMTLVTRAIEPNFYYGLTFSADGSTLYASGGESEVVYAFPFADGYLGKPRELRLAAESEQRVPCGLDLNPDNTLLAVAECWGNAVTIFDAASGEILHRIEFPDESRPYDVRFSADGDQVFISLWGGSAVAAMDLAADEAEPILIDTGDHPNELLLSHDGQRLFVANANVNTVSVINTKSLRVIETLNTALYPNALEGSTPNSLSLDPEERRLFVANADNNCIAVFDVSRRSRSRSLGLIPVGWYPTSVRVSPDGGSVYVANAKGFSSFANVQGHNPYLPPGSAEEASDTTKHPADENPIKPRISEVQYIPRYLHGTLSIIKTPEEDDYRELTRRVLACSPYRKDMQPVAAPPADNPIPGKVGGDSPIKYCIYIIKENRTYDQVLGDMPQGNGDAELCLFPEKLTPNHHALAREYVLLDNFYVDADVSADGHEWSTGAYATDFVQKTWPSNYGDHGLEYPAEGAYETALPTAGYIWDKCSEAGVSYQSLGEFIDHPDGVDKPGRAAVPALEGHFDPYFVGWNLDYQDVKRADRFVSEFNRLVAAGEWPSFTIMRLPNDHTQGSKKGCYTPTAYVGDNDLALGVVIEAISKSPIWKETAVFVVEDDAQAGPDHVDAHRTVALVVSPYTRGRGTDSTMYSTASMLRTMELCLGLKPMSQYDAGARPMYNTFQTKADVTPYACRPILEETRSRRNSPEAWGAELSAKLDFDEEDAADDALFNEIIWRNVKGADAQMPAPVRAAFVHPLDDDDESGEGAGVDRDHGNYGAEGL